MLNLLKNIRMQADRFLDELDKQGSARGNKGIKICQGLNAVERFFAWLFGNTIEVWLEGKKEPYVLGRKSAEQFLLRHKEEAKIDPNKNNLDYKEISEGLKNLFGNKEVQKTIQETWVKKKNNDPVKKKMYDEFYSACIGKTIKINNKDAFQVDTKFLLRELDKVNIGLSEDATEQLLKNKNIVQTPAINI
jgi:hypothetical protein